jgi:hypothetical protein
LKSGKRLRPTFAKKHPQQRRSPSLEPQMSRRGRRNRPRDQGSLRRMNLLTLQRRHLQPTSARQQPQAFRVQEQRRHQLMSMLQH